VTLTLTISAVPKHVPRFPKLLERSRAPTYPIVNILVTTMSRSQSHLDRALAVDGSEPGSHNSPGLRPWNANSYFAPKSSTDSIPATASDAGAGAGTPQELLRRLSLVDRDNIISKSQDPRAAHPGLNMSGNIISAYLCVPHNIKFGKDGHWVRCPLRDMLSEFC